MIIRSRSTMKSVIRDQEAVLELQGRMKWGNAEELVEEIVKNSQGLLSQGDAAETAKDHHTPATGPRRGPGLRPIRGGAPGPAPPPPKPV